MTDAPHPEFRLAVVGAGSWGTTLAGLAAGAAGGESGGPTVLWAREPEVADSINHAHVNPLFLSDHRLPPTLRATTSIAEALDGADALIMAVPSQFFRSVFQRSSPGCRPPRPCSAWSRASSAARSSA